MGAAVRSLSIPARPSQGHRMALVNDALDAPDQATPAGPTSLEELLSALDAARGLIAAGLPAAPAERALAYRNLYLLCMDTLRELDTRLHALAPEGEIASEQLASVCMLLGPYRNLTSLTGSVLSLHPQCLVLNHAGVRMLPNARLNFLINYSRDKFNEFVRYATYASQGGARGEYGGDIRHSHAFSLESMQRAAAALRGAARGPTKCLVWKDSHLVGNFLRAARVDVRRLLQRNDKLRFLLPIRDPIDCAISNLRTGHVEFFRESHGLSRASSVEDVVAAVLDEIAWFLALRDGSGRPESFFIYFEHEIGNDVLENMLRFLGLSRSEDYLAAAGAAFKVSRSRDAAPRPVEAYVRMVKQKFERHPGIRDGLMKFADR
jgi:hypothetical protein